MEKKAYTDFRFDEESFMIALKDEFRKRVEKNGQYSLRSFAKHLNMHAACLSVILKGKRPLTNKMMLKLSKALNYCPDKMNELSVSYKTDKTVFFDSLSIDKFALISQWYHDAILELIKLDEFVPSVSWIAEVLQVSEIEIDLAVQRLKRLEMIDTSKPKWICRVPDTDFTLDEFTTAGLKKYQEKALELSKESLNRDSIENRFHSTMTMAIDKELLDEAKKELREFRQKFCSQIQSKENFNKVYQLNIGFYPISH